MTPEVTYLAAASLDGYIATEDGGVDWLTPFQAGSGDRGLLKFYASIDALLMGSHTYEFALKAPEWPSPDKPTWVFTRRPLRQMHPSITLTADAPEAVMDRLHARGVRHAWLMGGGKLAASFREHGLISRYVIAVMPILLGRGIPLFAPGGAGRSLVLVAAEPFKNGVVQLTYRND